MSLSGPRRNGKLSSWRLSSIRPWCCTGARRRSRSIAGVLARARGGRSGALVVRGEAGIGKTVLLENAARNAADMTVLRGSGAETEADLPFAALHLILRPVLDRIGDLPPPQAGALRGAFALPGGTGQSGEDRFLVGLAVLTLLSELAEDRPLLCLIDDAQWLDRASADALFFAARRLYAEGIAMLFAARDGAGAFAAPGLAEQRLGGLDDDAASREHLRRGRRWHGADAEGRRRLDRAPVHSRPESLGRRQRLRYRPEGLHRGSGIRPPRAHPHGRRRSAARARHDLLGRAQLCLRRAHDAPRRNRRGQRNQPLELGPSTARLMRVPSR
jgi:hypothetical protein